MAEAVGYTYPEELEFFEREFGLSSEHDPDEGIFSYIYRYDDGRDLIITHSPCGGCSISARLIEGDETIFYAYQEGLVSLSFQAWGKDKVLRANFEPSYSEYRVSYLPKPKLHSSVCL